MTYQIRAWLAPRNLMTNEVKNWQDEIRVLYVPAESRYSVQVFEREESDTGEERQDPGLGYWLEDCSTKSLVSALAKFVQLVEDFGGTEEDGD